MDKKALQEQFEAIAIQNCWNINKYPAGWDGHGDDEYVDDFVSGAWWGFQEQQAKVEELETKLKQAYEDVDTFAEAHERECGFKAQLAKDKAGLQKRVDEITNIATELAEYASYAEIVGGVTVNRSAVRSFCDKVFDFNRKVDQELEQALKGEG